MYALWANIFDNPILVRELRRRMRGKALLYSIISYLFLMTLATILVMVSFAPSTFARPSTDTLQQLRVTGENIFKAITAIQVLLVIIIAPTITAGLTTGEKERQTFDFLRVTTISRWMYILGCFFSTTFYVGIALLCALPLLAVTFLYGGVSLGDVLATFVVLLCASCLLSAFGLFISSVTEKTRTAQGIVIFVIFGLLFGGAILVQSYRALFVGAASVLPAAGGLYLGSIEIPSWTLGPIGLLIFSGLFLLLAARKLFESDEARALNHWQYTAVFTATMSIFLGILGANQFSNESVEWAMLSLGYVLLLAGVLIFSTGRMEVGDEMWHLKRLVPILRPIDQTLPFLAFIGLIWYILVGMVPMIAPNLHLSAESVRGFQLASTASFAFFAIVGRAITGITGSAARALRTTFGLLVALVVVLPLLSAAGRFAVDADFVWMTVDAFSPLSLLSRAAFGNRTAGILNPALVATGIYIVGTILLGAIGETKRYQRWKNYDYHYDMPGR